MHVETPYSQAGDLTLDAEVCVVGSGAGGAVVAKELAEAGWDVVVLEQGRYVPTTDFTANPLEMMKSLYADIGLGAALGRPGVALPYGRCLGGTTTINSGTCFRTPDRILEYWRRRLGISISSAELGPVFDRVEDVIHVAPAEHALLGNSAYKIMAGAAKLGLSARPLNRNAQGCNGCGVCCFGCPSGAKQSMSVSYLPRAARAGARIFTGCRTDRITNDGRSATGVVGAVIDPVSLAETGRLKVRAPLVVLAAGALGSPLVLLRSGLKEGDVGGGLHLHPASKVSALFDEDIGWEGIPQSAYIDDLHDQGIMFEGVSTPPELGSLGLPYFGTRHQTLMENYRRLAQFGAMVEDTGHGRVRYGLWGTPFVTYDLHPRDSARLVTALALVAEIFFLAGAEQVYTPIHGHQKLDSLDDLARLRASAVRASDLDLIAFHPSGTCRMGADPHESVVDSVGQSHELRGLFVADGAVIPTPLGVNPQVTIMALATRTAQFMTGERQSLLA